MNPRDFPSLGSLRERVELLQRVQTIDAAGGHADGFVSLGLAWARVRSASGSIVDIADARNARVSHVITIRFRQDINPGDRLVYRSRQLEIISAADLNGYRAYLVLKCAQTDSTG